MRGVFKRPSLHREEGRFVACTPNDIPPWAAVYQQTQRLLAAGRFDALVKQLARGVTPGGGG
jgi:hypothetical protein